MFKYLRYYYYILIAMGCAQAVCCAQTSAAEGDCDRQRLLLAGQMALQQGFPVLAQGFFEDLVSHEGTLQPEIYERASIGLLESWIAQGSWQQARSWVQLHVQQINFSNPEAKFVQALLDWSAGNSHEAEEALSAICATQLPAQLCFEYYMLQGQLAMHKGQLNAARENFITAEQNARTQLQSAIAQSQVNLLDLKTHQVTEAYINALQKNLKKTRNRQAHAQLALNYAQMLVAIGRVDDAQTVLIAELKQLKSVDGALLDSALYLLALISPAQSAVALQSWMALLERGTASPSDRLQALYALRSTPESIAGWPEFLEKCLQTNRTEPLIDALLLEQAQWAFTQHNGAQAIEYIHKLLQRSPKSSIGPQAYALEALVALSQDPPQYRIAATALASGKRDFGEEALAPQWGLLEADCLYLAKDYAQAAQLYKSYIDVPPAQIDTRDVIFKWVWAQLEANNSGPVAAFLAQAGQSHAYEQSVLVRVAWYLARSEYQQGKPEQALASLTPWCTATALEGISLEWKAKVLWLAAVLDFQLGHTQFALTKAMESLQSARQAQGAFPLDGAPLVAECLLLVAQIEFRLDRPEAARVLLIELRDRYALSNPAEVSYLLEARYYARTHQWAQAQQSDLKLVELFPKSSYSPIALYEGALCAQRQGGVHSAEEAMRILDRIIKEYPNTEWVFEARFEQGQILRQLGRFGPAQLVYDGIIHDYPQLPDLWRARLARADCLLALSVNDPAKGALASAAYERIFDLTTLPNAARAEAGFKWGAALEEQNKQMAAKEAYWTMLNALLIQPQMVKQDKNIEGAFWMSRAVLALGQMLERENQPQEAYKVYGWIEQYGLPGQEWAKAKMERIEKS